MFAIRAKGCFAKEANSNWPTDRYKEEVARFRLNMFDTALKEKPC
jgi:hypothetical protein